MTEEESQASPLLPVILGASLAATVAAIVVRLFTTGGGIELFQPGAQLLFDALTLAACFSLVLGRYPGVHGTGASRKEVLRLRDEALAALAPLGPAADHLRELCEYMAVRTR